RARAPRRRPPLPAAPPGHRPALRRSARPAYARRRESPRRLRVTSMSPYYAAPDRTVKDRPLSVSSDFLKLRSRQTGRAPSIFREQRGASTWREAMHGWIRFVRLVAGAGFLAMLSACGDPATAPPPPPQLNL